MRLIRNKNVKVLVVATIVAGSFVLPSFVQAQSIFQEPHNNFRPNTIHIVNGSFEMPQISSRFYPYNSGSWNYIPAMNELTGGASLSNTSSAINALGNQSGGGTGSRASLSYVDGWNAVPSSTVTHIIPRFANYIEVQRAGANSNFPSTAADGQQYIELDADQPSYVYQTMQTTPGSRLYYSFNLRNRGGSGRVKVYVKGSDASRGNATQDIETHSSHWEHYEGVYTVPEGQYRTDIGFESMSEETAARGNLLDHVEVRTGAYLEVNKSSSVLGEEVLGGTIYTYTLHIENFGQTDADQLIVTDQLDGDVDFIGNAKKDGVDFTGVSYDEEHKKVLFHLSGDTIGNVDANHHSMDLSYQVRVKDTATEGEIKSQASIDYHDANQDSSARGIFYSGVDIVHIGRRPAVAQGSIRVQWNQLMPTLVNSGLDVQLYRNGEIYGWPVHIDAMTQWEYHWNNLVDENNTTSVWTVRLLNSVENYQLDIENIRPREWVIRANFSNPGSNTQDRIVDDVHSQERVKVLYSLTNPEDQNIEGRILHYKIRVKNDTSQTARGIWIRDVMPLYTHFDAVDTQGEYGVIEGREHATWFVDRLLPGEEKEFWVDILQDFCCPEIQVNQVNYELTGNENRPYVNDPVGPRNVAERF